MNSPPVRPEQLSPALSPIAFSLDDPNHHNNGFQHLLASPTKLKLDKGVNARTNNNGGSNGQSLIYRTSLSKLSELSRSGRSRQRSNSDTLRSASPIRFQLFNNAPKMLKPEYMSQQAPSLPLLSTLMKTPATGIPTGTKQESKNNQTEPAAWMSIRETLEKLQRDQRQAERQKVESKDRRQEEPANVGRQPVSITEPQISSDRKVSESTSATSGVTLCDKQRDPNETVKFGPSRQRTNEEIRLVSNSSLASSTVSIDFNELPKDIDLEALATDKNGFAHSDDFKSNRCSFISSTSTDYDADWCNQQVVAHEETAKLDHRIKQLEVEIAELKLQNEKLIHSITASRTVEDMFMLDALKEIRASKREAQKGMERKVKQLEKKVENYRNAIKTRGDSPPEEIASKDKRATYPTGESIQMSTLKRRIARISSLELRKIDEQGDSTSSSSSDDEMDVKLDKPESFGGNMLTNQSRHPNDLQSMSMRRKAGLQLNIHVKR
ncbi:hypothetical protein HG536_0B05420 [Torulaspora globosa]|uniref:Uncharacterized protein n=1 Tax=Torulaspora globosa TaxID=48254 RepID=A0A7G3ZDU1_9SACH|nr:uncharacterized protein HG536_0B05420 [Torulaspora globosa]QLL31677.1 hypothetical protein HG536_0B05420 [Torulaspora globosa]